MANLNNPAGRLLYWLRLADQRPKDQSALAQWCGVWDLDQSSIEGKFECMRRGAMLMSLAVQVRADAEHLPSNLHPSLMLKNFPEVEQALDRFTILATARMSDFFAPLHGTGWQSLEMLDALLSSNRPEHTIDLDEVVSHLDTVRHLIEDVLADAELNADLKRYIVARLRDVERALSDAPFTGIGEVELAANSMLGAVQREPDTWDRIAKSKWGPRIGGVWLALMTTLGGLGGIPALLPGFDAAPLQINNTVVVNVANSDDEEVVDAEIVEGATGPTSAEDQPAVKSSP